MERDWSFLTNHARALLYIAHDPEARLRDIASALDVTERTAFGVVADLADAGYVEKERTGRRNRYHIRSHLPLGPPDLPMSDSRNAERTIGEVLDLLATASTAAAVPGTEHGRRSTD